VHQVVLLHRCVLEESVRRKYGKRKVVYSSRIRRHSLLTILFPYYIGVFDRF